MGWATAEDRVAGRVRILTTASAIACILTSILYISLALTPLWLFRGYVSGHYSLLDYRLHYIHSGQPASMPHTEYVRHVSLAFTALSTGLLILSATSIALARQRPYTAAGLAYGASSSLGVLYGLLSGYILRAVELDMSRFSMVLGDSLVVRISAGTIVYTGVELKPTPISTLTVDSPTIPAILAFAIVASATAAGLAISRLYSSIPQAPPVGKPTSPRHTPRYAAILTLSIIAMASAFAYYPLSVSIAPQPPPATLEHPPYSYACLSLTRTARGALTYTDFEDYPVGWTSYGGEWGLSTGGGFRGNALRGRNNNRGVGRRSSQYYWNTRIDGYSSLWVSVRTRAEGDDGYKGIGLLNADRTRLYEISVQSTATIRKWDGDWRLLGSVPIPGYSATRWYTLVLRYEVTAAAVNFQLWVYNDTGILVANLTANDTGTTRFTPAYAGITIDAVPPRWFRFDDFVVSTTDPRNILFTGFYSGMRVGVWDNLGNLVNLTVVPAGQFTLGVTRDIVVGTGVDGRIELWYPDAYPCGTLTVPGTDAILGGDIYSLATASMTVSLGSNRTSANVTIPMSGLLQFNTVARVLRLNAAQVLYARLILDSISVPPTLNIDVWVEGAARSTNITVRGGVSVSTSTSIVRLNTGLRNSIVLSGRFTALGQTAALGLRLELCTAQGGAGACAYYPVVLNLYSPSTLSLGSASVEPVGVGDLPPSPGEWLMYGDEAVAHGGEGTGGEAWEPPERREEG